MKRKTAFGLALCLSAFLALPSAAQPTADRVLRVVPHADLRNLDPVAASIVITRMHGMMIYETLFAWDSQLNPQPQMVDRFEQSPDGLSWTFHLRDGLRFHDGQPVTTRDVIPSLNRWMARDTLGGKLKEYVASLDAVDDRTFVLRLQRPMGLVPFALGSAVGYIPVIMREVDATTDPLKPVTSVVGSGPFRFNRGQWQPGARVIYDRNADYVPRQEPTNGLAGGRVVKVDRVEWHILPDPATAAAALQTGEIDIWEQPAQDLIPTIERARGIRVESYSSLPNQAMLRPNQLHRPFSDPRVRQAVALLTDQGDFMAAGFGDERFWRRCNSYFVCGSPNGTEAGAERFGQTNVEMAKQLLAEAGYRGEKVVLISTHEIPYMGRMAEVAAAALARGGINVDLQFTDWGAVSARLQNRETNDKGGWDMFITSSSGATMQSPATNIGTNMGCARAWVGWPCDAEAERLRAAVVDAPDSAARATATETLHRRLAEMQPYRVLGQYDQPYARRANVSAVPAAPIMVFWDVEKR